jgi:glycosyltransferase involved in cell wall biosynthesis
VAVPGTVTVRPATGSVPPRPPLLRQLAAVSPVKDQLGVVEALAQVGDLPWAAQLSGALDVDAGYTDTVRTAIDRHGLGDRVRLTGPLGGQALEDAWDETDVLLLPSRAETWGMVVTEALSRGIPAIVSSGTGAQEALGRTADGELPGALVPPGHPDALAAAIRHLLGPGREQARRAALERRQSLPTWQATALAVQEALA